MRIVGRLVEEMQLHVLPIDKVYFGQMQRAVDKFIAHIVQQISTGKVPLSANLSLHCIQDEWLWLLAIQHLRNFKVSTLPLTPF